jgi:hypothetical protein
MGALLYHQSTTTLVAVESLARTWLEVGAAASVHGWSSKAVHQIETELSGSVQLPVHLTSTSRQETCGPHVSKANSLELYTYTYVVRQRRNRVRFNCNVSFLLVIHPAQKDGADPISSASFGRRLPCLIPIT